MWKILLSACLWLGYLLVMNHSWQINALSLPPLGMFFSPGQGFWQNAESVNDPSGTREIVLGGLQSPVHIVFDERLVPHIFAEHPTDAWFAQGYVTAMYRLWQMDISVRATAGKLSEALGERTLDYDKKQRELGMGYAAENAVKGWSVDPDGVAAVDAYTAGVNAYINTLRPKDYPVEFKLMGYAPEPWTTLKTALFVKSMASKLGLSENDLEHTTLLKWLGPERFHTLFRDHNPLEDPIIPPGTPWDFEFSPSVDTTTLPETIGDHPSLREQDPLNGSNNWAVAGDRTRSGKPILCNDPHLGLSLPSVWYEVHLHTPAFNVYGASLPGAPGVIIGFNEHLSWGITNTGYDVLDWYAIQWTDDTKTAYWLDGLEVPVSYRMEEIRIKGQPPVYDTVSYTHWGPVQKTGPHAGYAMRWLSHEIPDAHEPGVFLNLNKATSKADFVHALSAFQSPLQNFVYADVDGNIGMQISGKMPLRPNRNGEFIQDGSKTANGWNGRIPFAYNPAIYNPARGFVSSANQESTDTTYPYLYLGLFEDFRGRILNRYLAEVTDAEPGDMEAIQLSNVSLKAENILPDLLSVALQETPEEKQAHDILDAWRYDYTAESTAAVLFELWYQAFNDLLWDDFRARMDSLYIRRPHEWRTELLVTQEKLSPEFDLVSTPKVETFKDIAALSLKQAISDYAALHPEQRKWGMFRETTIRHLANIAPFSEVIHASGHGDALNATTSSHGPSWRMIVSMTEPVEAYVVYPGGQSGNPASPHYMDMISHWQNGEYYRAYFVRTPDDLAGVYSIQFKPAGK